MRLTRRGRAAIMVAVATLLSVCCFWLGARTAAHAAMAPNAATAHVSTADGAAAAIHGSTADSANEFGRRP
ncbi:MULTISPECIES: hypothetical protein [unclassified Nonomuraea]|uniref:hypothetical protein n=1 Tax=unclassified Nonomuraea TaxID=2593643 RepID=UPI00340951A1